MSGAQLGPANHKREARRGRSRKVAGAGVGGAAWGGARGSGLRFGGGGTPDGWDWGAVSKGGTEAGPRFSAVQLGGRRGRLLRWGKAEAASDGEAVRGPVHSMELGVPIIHQAESSTCGGWAL